MKYTIGGYTFKNKTEITEKCRDILYDNIGLLLEPDSKEENFMYSIFQHHPSKTYKLKDFSGIIVDIDSRGTHCFYIVNSKGRKVDISFKKCINNIPVPSAHKVDYIFRFGKYKDKSIYDINDKEYLKYISKLKFLNRSDKIMINQFIRYGYIPYNHMFVINSDEHIIRKIG